MEYPLFDSLDTTTKTNVAILLLNAAIGVRNSINQRSHEKKLSEQTERLKHELQMEFCKAEFKTRNIFKIYPETFEKFKLVEMEFRYVFGGNRINPIVYAFEEDKANKLFGEAAQYFLTNLLFFSSSVRDAGMLLKNNLNNTINMQYSLADINEEWKKKELKEMIKNSCAESYNLMDALEQCMKKEMDIDLSIEKEKSSIYISTSIKYLFFALLRSLFLWLIKPFKLISNKYKEIKDRF